ncbi:hypothetical protein EGW08_019420 [Elysia chlorotica]|uniref:Pseudouridine synthase RsuA/RluA-like domain-containing protein n=1 Tax=Elysia chlorotica TaxID=188477 RepID=A0A433SU89_ELYCH|nr:hypothetical protein EGW08_019420 [Elysia chlorotica]
MSPLKLSLGKLLDSSATYLYRRSRTEDYQQVTQFVKQYFSYRHMHINRSFKPSKESQILESTQEQNSFSTMDSQPESIDSSTLSKRAQKRLARSQKYAQQQKQRKAEQKKMAQNDDAGYCKEDFYQSTYYFENGLRKVYPYTFTFATFAKGRWVGRTIENVLEKEFGFDQPEDLEKAFNTGQIHVNNKQVGPDYIVRDCDHLSHKIHRHENPVTWAPIEIIKDTEELVVINKPSSIPCHPCGRYRFNSIVFILGKEMGYTNLRNIYRLDRLTSGVLMLAKTTETTKILEDQVANRHVQKEYVCRVAGKFPEGLIVVEQPLRALSNKLRLQIVCPTGKASRTEFELINYNGKSSVVRCKPLTGRTHQIRVHLQYLGHPIINDVFYNNAAWGPGNGKGGNYEVPFEDVCAKILKDHHASLWDGGENPLYFEKVKKMEEEQLKAEKTKIDLSHDTITSSVLIAGNPTNCDSLKASSSLTSESDSIQDCNSAVANNEQDPSRHLGEGSETEPPCKKFKGNQIEGQTNTLTPPTSITSSEDHQTKAVSNLEETSQIENNVTDISGSSKEAATEGECHLTDSSDPHKQLSLDAIEGNSQNSGQSLSDAKSLDTRPGFEMSQWSIDTGCSLCKRIPVEPKERDMVMFLHALKYKGPDWEYETSLPDWAKADWSLEEDFIDEGSVNCR